MDGQTKFLKVTIKGLKCDKAGCDYVDQTITLEQYRDYLDAPCPKCGASLLTKADMRTIKILLFIVRLLNRIIGHVRESADSKRVNVKGEMNGTGTIRFKL